LNSFNLLCCFENENNSNPGLRRKSTKPVSFHQLLLTTC
jgi:hypothetical protein